MKRQHRRWWLANAPDVLGALADQAAVTLKGMEAFARWSAGAEPATADDAAAVRVAEHEADAARRLVARRVRESFITPVNPEDVFELSERLDTVMNAAKNLVREAEVLSIAPDGPMGEMAKTLLAGVADLAGAFGLLASEPDKAYQVAEEAISAQHSLEKTYRAAMGALLEERDSHVIAAKRELYRRYARLADAIELLANRVEYTVVKEA